MGARRGPTPGAIALITLALSACGGKLLAVAGAGDASSGVGDAGAVPVANTGSSTGGVGPTSGGSASSGGSTIGGSASSGGNPIIGGSTSGGGSVGGGSSSGVSGVACTNSAACPAGEVCCGTIMMTTACQSGPCPSTPIGPIQLCTTAAECFVRGDTCGPIPQAPMLPVMICSPSTGATAPSCATTCSGCCQPDGACNMGVDATACGKGGAVCVDCTTVRATGHACINQACQ